MCKYILAAELLALADGFDIGYSITHALIEIMGRKIHFITYTDSWNLYRLYISLAPTTEQRLQTDLSLITKVYERRDIYNIRRIFTMYSSGDDLTKAECRCGSLPRLLVNNYPIPTAEGRFSEM